MSTQQTEEQKIAKQYVARIKTPAKRQYAEAYLEHLLSGTVKPNRPRLQELSYMAAQAVEIRLRDILIWNEVEAELS